MGGIVAITFGSAALEVGWSAHQMRVSRARLARSTGTISQARRTPRPEKQFVDRAPTALRRHANSLVVADAEIACVVEDVVFALAN
jgi:uncharacterized protein (DUF169 family)